MMNLRHLEVFQAIMETGSASAAASLLGVSQPAISRTLAQVEETLGFKLFLRDKGRLVPTDQARALLEGCEKIFADLEGLSGLVNAIRAGVTGRLRIASSPSFAEQLLPRTIKRFGAANPGVSIQVELRSARSIVSMVADRNMDVGLLALPADHPSVEAEALVEVESVCAIPADHPLAGREVVDPRDLHHAPMILLARSDPTRAFVDQAFADAYVTPDIRVETPSVVTACALVAEGVGIAVVNGLMAAPFAQRGVRIARFSARVTHRFGLIRPARTPASAHVRAFRDALVEQISQDLPPHARLLFGRQGFDL